MAEKRIGPDPQRMFKKYLVERLRARAGLDNVRILPAEFMREGQKDHVFVVNGGSDQVTAANGTGRRRHSMSLAVIITVYRVGGDEQAAQKAEDAAFDILDEIETEIEGSAAGKQLNDERGRATVLWAHITKTTWDAAAEKQQRWFVVRAELKAEAETQPTEE